LPTQGLIFLAQHLPFDLQATSVLYCSSGRESDGGEQEAEATG